MLSYGELSLKTLLALHPVVAGQAPLSTLGTVRNGMWRSEDQTKLLAPSSSNLVL